MVQLTPAQIEQFNTDGFLILNRFLSAEEVALARTRFEPLFRGEFETGLYPDEWNWRGGRGPAERAGRDRHGRERDRPVSGRMELARGAGPGGSDAADLQRLEVRSDHRSDRAERGGGPPVRDAGGGAGGAYRAGERGVEG